VEIAFFDRGPLDASRLITGGFWSAYWFNGRIYASEIARGLDIFRLSPSDQLSKNEIAAAHLVRYDEFNVQFQPKVTWPATPVVARAYLDQLVRSKGIAPARAAAVGSALDRADKLHSAKDRGAAELAGELDAMATQLSGDGDAAGADAARQRGLASTLRGIAAKLH
jgi:hypothetical protein